MNFHSITLAAMRFALLLCLFALLTQQGYAQKVPEFDGAYLVLKSGELKEMKQIPCYTTMIPPRNISTTQLGSLPIWYYVVDKSSAITVPITQIEGFIIKGKYQFENFSVHPLVEFTPDGENTFLFENKGPAQLKKPLFYAGQKYELQKKATGADSYYFKTREALKAGDYVAWINGDFWLFTLK